MLGQAALLVLFLFLRGHQGHGCSDSTVDMVSVSGSPLWLRPSNIQTHILSIQWKKTQLGSPEKSNKILIRYTCNKTLQYYSNGFNKTYDFNASDLALGIKSAKLQDSGHYELEMTNKIGIICSKKFQILIVDRVEKPHLQGQWKIGTNGMCQLSLDCLVPRDDNVSYALYRGSKLISKLRNLTHLESQTEASSLHTYTCNVSNQVSWEVDTLNITQGCQSVSQKPSPKNFSTIYEHVKDPQGRRNQVGHSGAPGSPSAVQENGRGQTESNRCHFEEQMPEQKTSGDGSTIYSMIQYKPSDPTPQEKCTLYAVIQPSRKYGSKKRNWNPSSNCTVYEEVGKQYLKAQNPARLSRRELENFDIYS
ncbi:natural killer cell receptor 2B4 isoform X2 [Phodopus roborovskii]|uniref:natural killer cell receptor 2B4 isoform X2 n=1 Tax=Phodopus roborovskii TaxID=109678 RepID=UPI0021E4A59C|nr:natural killer cell receptor 2B4 isoform X2 [Phodopus roborovskii]